MAQESLKQRIDRLERQVEILKQLPERVTALGSQIVLLRDEVRSEFSALRLEIDERVIKGLREEIHAGDEETRRVLTARMESLFDANERHMRLLHEDLVERIARSNEGR